MDKHIPVPVAVAAYIAQKYKKSVVIINAWDPESQLIHTTTFGVSDSEKFYAARAGEITSTALGAYLDKAKYYEDFRKETCICSAVKMPDGYIVRGHRHNDCFRTAAGIRRYKKVRLDSCPQGFITSSSRFVDREEGLRLQLKAGIKSADRSGAYSGIELYSEDLY